MATAEPRTLHDFCRRVLGCGGLEPKLAPPPRALADPARPPLAVDAPARDRGLRLAGGAGKLPRPGELTDPAARARCLARFAHHELQAVELFAWALLRWPRVPAALRRGWLGVLTDEQRHCRLYLERLRAHGSRLADHAPHSDYFWHQAPAVAASAHGPSAFLSAMGLTLEQANLDFTGVYRDGFRAAGDEASARVCERVHRDEIRHVRVAAEWLERLAPAPERAAPGVARDGETAPFPLPAARAEGHRFDAVERYRETVPFPLSAARAKGRRFDARARREAGLSEEFIDYVRTARSTSRSPRR